MEATISTLIERALLPVAVAGFMSTAAPASGVAQTINLACFEKPGVPDCLPNGDIDFATTPATYNDRARAYAFLVWNDFLALNAPAATDVFGNASPEPSPDHNLTYNGGEYQTVWETYIAASDLFSPNPPPFGTPAPLPDICTAEAERVGRTDVRRHVSRVFKTDLARGANDAPVGDEYIQANRMGPVADADGNYLRFELLFNRAMYDYVVANGLNTAAGQEAYNPASPGIDWPRGAYTTAPVLDEAGSIMLKAAWKVLMPSDDAAAFHRIEAYVYNAAGGAFGQEPEVEESCSLQMLGLVGLHIVHRTNSSPQWVWATFEHGDNAPWLADIVAGSSPAGRYSLFDTQQCTGPVGTPDCPMNRIPAHPWNPGTDPTQTGANPTQVVRLAAPGLPALQANQEFRASLEVFAPSSVWENYYLVDVQFPTLTIGEGNEPHDVNPAYPLGLPTPTFLANSTMETYIQGFSEGDVTTNGNLVSASDTMLTIGNAPVDPWLSSGPFNRSGGANRNTSSCMGCHADSAMVDGRSGGAVFSPSRAE